MGAGNTGCDIAGDAATVADGAAISMRRGYRVLPKHIFGRPADVFAQTGPHLPGPAQQKIFNKLLELDAGVPASTREVLADRARGIVEQFRERFSR